MVTTREVKKCHIMSHMYTTMVTTNTMRKVCHIMSHMSHKYASIVTSSTIRKLKVLSHHLEISLILPTAGGKGISVK